MAEPLPTNELRTLRGHTGAVNVAVFNSTGSYAATGGSDKLIKLWNPVTGLCIKTYTGHGYEVLDIDIALDNAKFASVGGDRAALLWDVSTGRVIRRFTGHTARINGVAFNKDATVIVTGSYDATVRFWDCRSQDRAPIQVLNESKDSVTSIQVVDHQIVAGSVDGHFRLYDIRLGKCTADNVGHPVTSAVLSNDKNCVLASSLDSTLRLFDIENGELLAEYKGHTNTSYKITATLTSSDAYVISGSEDGRICYWDLVEGSLLQSIQAHSKLVTCVAYHPKEDILISTSTDGMVKVFGA
ncbi:WD40-repeat-containing domain protein [Zopfochytrium polystomum]|nr:WD40-repeat-containing domain protein [Zopfochytrium polystomum]